MGKKFEIFFPENEMRRREMGFKCTLGWEENLRYSLYSSLRPCNSWNPVLSHSSKSDALGIHHGGIFNLEFSPDGKQLVAACEQQAIMIFDSLTKKQIHNVGKAHLSCVNGIKFLDSRVFATCSDDKTVALWDVRNLQRKIVRLFGHNNWVKNIEYCSEEGLLVTSGFDGRILAWNINRDTEGNGHYSELFKMQGLMRMRLTPDSSKLIICTTGGYIVIVHDLDLNKLSEDLKNFKPDFYRLMQISSAFLPQPTYMTDIFKRKRNRIQFISDFPPGNDAEVIHSLQVHPQAWCVLSRNTSSGDSSEWTCVHDIQSMEEMKAPSEGALKSESKKRKLDDSCEGTSSKLNRPSNSNDENSRLSDVEVVFRSSARLDLEGEDEIESRNQFSELGNDENSGVGGSEELLSPSVAENFVQSSRPSLNLDSEVTNENSSSSSSSSGSGELPDEHATSFIPRQQVIENRTRNFRNIIFIRSGSHAYRSILLLHPRNDFSLQSRSFTSKPPHIGGFGNPRLTNFIEEPNKGKGFIKELCFSPDGRLICSPFDCGVRLLMFSDTCSELSHCVQSTPQQLRVISTNICHNSCVVSTKFSPVDCLLVSGCLNGKIVWHQPVI